MSTTTASRRTKWHPTPPPPPSPKILHFPRSRRTRRRQTKPTTQNHHHHHDNQLLLMHQNYMSSSKGKLESLFDQENTDPSNSNSKISVAGRRERVEEEDEEEFEGYNGGGGSGGFAEEKWRFQAEILRAECNLLRMEREFALKKLEKNRVKMERTLRSAVQTLASGREKIFEGKNVKAVLEEEIEDLAEKLEELQKSSRIKDNELRNCTNFDKKACILQRRLEKLGGLPDESRANELQELAGESSLLSSTTNIETDVDMLKKKMEGFSKGMLERVEEEYNSILSSTANSSVASSASTSKRIDWPEISTRHLYQEKMMMHENKCSGRCKIIVRRIVEQVRAETEQWSQMQQMLRQVRGEMEQLHGSRDFWENRARNSDIEIQSLRQSVEEWRERAHAYESKANKVQLELSILKEEIQKSKTDLIQTANNIPPVPLGKQLDKEKLLLSFRSKENEEGSPSKDLPPLSLGRQLAKEKRMFLRRLKEKRNAREKVSKVEISDEGRMKMCSNGMGVEAPTRRSPLRDIGNSSPLARQKSRPAFVLHSPESSRIRESFRK